MDKTVKLWDLSNNEPSCLATHKPKAVRTNQHKSFWFPITIYFFFTPSHSDLFSSGSCVFHFLCGGQPFLACYWWLKGRATCEWKLDTRRLKHIILLGTFNQSCVYVCRFGIHCWTLMLLANMGAIDLEKTPARNTCLFEAVMVVRFGHTHAKFCSFFSFFFRLVLSHMIMVNRVRVWAYMLNS